MKVVVNVVMEYEMLVEIWKLLVVFLKKVLINMSYFIVIFILL